MVRATVHTFPFLDGGEDEVGKEMGVRESKREECAAIVLLYAALY